MKATEVKAAAEAFQAQQAELQRQADRSIADAIEQRLLELARTQGQKCMRIEHSVNLAIIANLKTDGFWVQYSNGAHYLGF